MKLNKFAYLYSKPLGNHTLKIMKKYLEIYLKTWKNHGNIMEFCQSEKVGTLVIFLHLSVIVYTGGVWHTPPGRHPLRQTPPLGRPPPHKWPLQQTVHILLECILV